MPLSWGHMDKLITVTERALLRAKQTRDSEPDAEELALFLEVQPAGYEWTYDLYLDALANARPDDHVQEEDGLRIVVPESSVEHIKGATLDLSRNLLNPGWTITNPNVPSPSPAVGGAVPQDLELTGDVPERVEQVLEQVINPSIASHGGRAELVGVEGSVAYLQLAGGCQGCGMAQVTLTQGIQVAITEAVPEITEVRDVTDHAAGENPYFQPAKK